MNPIPYSADPAPALRSVCWLAAASTVVMAMVFVSALFSTPATVQASTAAMIAPPDPMPAAVDSQASVVAGVPDSSTVFKHRETIAEQPLATF